MTGGAGLNLTFSFVSCTAHADVSSLVELVARTSGLGALTVGRGVGTGIVCAKRVAGDSIAIDIKIKTRLLIQLTVHEIRAAIMRRD
jgi:hypothetical protein